MGNTATRYGPIPATFEALFDSSEFRRDALAAARRLRECKRRIDERDVRTKLWELKGDMLAELRFTRRLAKIRRARLRAIEAVLSDYAPAPPPDLQRLIAERDDLRQFLARPPHAPQSSPSYIARIADLRSLGVPRHLLRRMIRGLAVVRVRGPRPRPLN